MARNPDVVPLEEWFSLVHYKPTSGWALDRWFLAISNRFAFRTHITYRPQGELDLTASDFFRTIAARIVSVKPGGSYRFNPSRHIPIGGAPIASPSLMDVTVDPAWWEHFRERWDDQSFLTCGPLDVGQPTQARLLAVDMSASDALLERQFKLWLKEAREVSGPGRRASEISQADMDAWFASGVLPYLDLCLWRDTYHLRLTQPEIAALLFPYDFGTVDVVERVRKVTARYARLLMTAPMFQRIEAQVADQLLTQADTMNLWGGFIIDHKWRSGLDLDEEPF